MRRITGNPLTQPRETIAMNTPSLAAFVVALLAPLSAASTASAQVPQQVPDAIAAPTETLIATAHAEGAQIYDCKADAGGQLVWQFREPIATLLIDGKTVGRHYAGPTWEMLDGSAVVGKQAARAPGATPEDIPWLKLDVASSRGTGRLSGVTTVQRLNTKGGVAVGQCDTAGALRSVPYSADYTFLKKGS
ncbi:DUF3455 domain-containing protein [Starkeya sp. ORNL1]|uniref:DUF3455 domain-containing protein n=1 Tax=Starkeya sp. ORNL1 TaxID=2709380 RepID=UPI001FEEF3AF|nr:DUF3455 domain-containing protein [Starkeya sp. ORNL1]